MTEYFDKLSLIWQNQKTVDKKPGLSDQAYNKVIDKIKQFEHKQLWINRTKSMIVFFLLLSISYIVLFRISGSLLTYFAFAGFLLSVVIFIRLYWKMQFKLSKMDFSKNSTHFIAEAVKVLQDQPRLFKKIFIPLLISVIVFFNLMYLDFFSMDILADKFIFHITFSLFIGLSGFVGLKIRGYRFKKEQQPLIDTLVGIQKELQE